MKNAQNYDHSVQVMLKQKLLKKKKKAFETIYIWYIGNCTKPVTSQAASFYEHVSHAI